jgi:excisionase family DNA binding protein
VQLQVIRFDYSNYTILPHLLNATYATKHTLDIYQSIAYCGGMKLFLNASEFAKLLGVSRATVTRWVKKGLIKGVIRPTGARTWRIPLTSYEQFVKTQR